MGAGRGAGAPVGWCPVTRGAISNRVMYVTEPRPVSAPALLEPDAVARWVRDNTDILQCPRERILVIPTDARRRPIGCFVVSEGTVVATIFHPREAFIPALLCNATDILLVHNHPSGDPTPSGADYAVTERARRAGEILGVALVDHIVVAVEGWASAMDRPVGGLTRGTW